MGKTGPQVERGEASDMGTTLLVVAGCLLLLAGLVTLRQVWQVEIVLADVALVAAAFGLYLFLTGRISKLRIGGVTIERAVSRAHGTSIHDQVTDVSSLPVDRIEYWEKGDRATLDRIVKEGGEALSLQFGHGGYRGPILKEYLDELIERGNLQWIVFLEEDGDFWAMVQAAALRRTLEGKLSSEELAQAMNAGDRGPLRRKVAGLIPAGAAVEAGTERRAALQAMEEYETDVLPVLDESGELRGVTERSRLVARILLDVDYAVGSGSSAGSDRP